MSQRTLHTTLSYRFFFCLFVLDVFCVRLPGGENNRFYESKLLTQQLSTILAGLSVSRVLAGLPYVCVCVWDCCLRSFRKAHFASGPETIEHGFLSLLLLSVGLRLLERERETPDVPPPASPPPPPPPPSSASSSSPPPPSLPPLWWLREMCLARLPLRKPRADENGVKLTEDSFIRIWLD